MLHACINIVVKNGILELITLTLNGIIVVLLNNYRVSFVLYETINVRDTLIMFAHVFGWFNTGKVLVFNTYFLLSHSKVTRISHTSAVHSLADNRKQTL